MLCSLACAVGVYAVTNPFVIYNAVARPEILRSNLGNSTAMYGVQPSLSLISDSLRVMERGMTTLGARVAVAIATAYLVIALVRTRNVTSFRPALPLLAAPATCMAVQFVLLAAGKPAEYARFGLVAMAGMCSIAFELFGGLRGRSGRTIAALAVGVIVAMLIPSSGDAGHFSLSKWPTATQTADAVDGTRQLNEFRSGEPFRIGVMYEPAPWSCPPVNLFEQKIVLVSPDPRAFDSIDGLVWPLNLQSQLIGSATDRESVNWQDNRFGMRVESRDDRVDRWGGWH